MAEPRNADDPWTGMDLGTYIHQPGQRHVCPLPAQWTPGTVWRCPDGHLWTIDTACGTCRWLGKGEGGARHVHTIGHAWWPAGWWQRRLAWLRNRTSLPMRPATLDMAGPNRVQDLPKPPPPRGPGGTGAPRPGRDERRPAMEDGG